MEVSLKPPHTWPSPGHVLDTFFGPRDERHAPRQHNGRVPISSGEPRRRAEITPYVDLSRAEWSALREKTPLPLTAEEVERLRGLGDVIDLEEVRDVYLPLSRLLNLYVGATSNLRGALNTFLDRKSVV